jgi:hypothetical protein
VRYDEAASMSEMQETAMRIKIYYTAKHDDNDVTVTDQFESKSQCILYIYEARGFWVDRSGTTTFVPWHRIDSFEVVK